MHTDLSASLADLRDGLAGPWGQVIVIVVAAIGVRWIVHRAINRGMTAMRNRPRSDDNDTATAARWRAAAGLDDERRRQRAATVGSLLKSVTTVTVVVIAALTVAAQLGIQLAPLMASAGVAGVALGFGAQSLVKDFLSGIFMIVEDQYGVGDVIDTGEAVGTVEEVSLRITRLRDANGAIWYVRNGEIVRVANRSQGWSTALVDVPVAYASSVTEVTRVLKKVVSDLAADTEWGSKLIEEPTVAGVESVAAGAMTFRIIAKTVANEHFAVGRELRERAVVALEEAGIHGPPLPTGGYQPASATNQTVPRPRN